MTGQKLRPPGNGVREKKTLRIASHAATPQALRQCRAEDETLHATTLHATTPKSDDLRNRCDPLLCAVLKGTQTTNCFLGLQVFNNEVCDPRKPFWDHGETISP